MMGDLLGSFHRGNQKQIRESLDGQPMGVKRTILVVERRDVTDGIRATHGPFGMLGQTSLRTMSP